MLDFRVSPRAIADLGWDALKAALAGRCATPWGAELARALPFLQAEAAQERVAHIEECRRLLRRELVLPFGEAPDVRDLAARADKGAVLAAAELLACAAVGRSAGAVKRFIAGLEEAAPLLAGMASELVDLTPLATRIESTFEPSGVMRDEASPALASYRRRARALHHEIKNRLQQLLRDPVFQSLLQDGYFSLRNDRYVLPVKAQARGEVPGIVHNASQSGQTIFVEPEAFIAAGNELAIAESLAAEEERRVLAELSAEVGGRSQALTSDVERLAELDGVQAAARLADALDATPVEVVGDQIELRSVRHPLLVLQGKPVVSNTIALSGVQQALVISGPNAGGKTVAMATVGMCALMARAGLPVPAAAGSRLPLFSGVACAIGDAQDLSRDLSTFTAHLGEVASILASAQPGQLALIDEIAAGTDPTEGAALATAVLEALVDSGVRVVVTTHLDPVKALAVTDRRFVNARFSLHPETLRPTFELELGAAGVSKAIDVAAQVGLPPQVVERARLHLESKSQLGSALAALEAERQQLARERLAAAQRQAAADALGAKLAAELARAVEARQAVEVAVRAELAAELAAAEKLAAEAVARLQGASMAEAQRAQKDLRAAREAEQRRAAELEARQRDPVAPGAVVLGARVRVPALGKEGEVVALGDGQALVKIGALRTRVRVGDLVLLSGAAPKSPKEQREAARRPAAPDTPRELDVRGMRADEAVRRVEGLLDQAYAGGTPRVVILHGHGGGGLRHAVREALTGSPYVSDFGPGGADDGGEGVTVVRLRS